MLSYYKQFKGDDCLAKVTEVHPDEDGLKRKVTDSYMKNHPNESPQIYKLVLAGEDSVDGVPGQSVEGVNSDPGQVVGQVGDGGDGAPVHGAG